MKQPFTVLEQGDIYFFYRPRVQTEEVHHLDDIQRINIVIKGNQKPHYRLIIVGKKHLPSYDESPIEFAFVDAVYKRVKELVFDLDSQHYETKTRGERTLPAVRLFAEGKYILLKDNSTVHLVYLLDQHQKLGSPQIQFNIEYTGNWIVSVKNPLILSQRGLTDKQKAQFPLKLPKKLVDRFKDRKFIPLNPPEYLNYPGTELLLIAEKSNPEDKWGDRIREAFASFPHLDGREALELDKSAISTKSLTGVWD